MYTTERMTTGFIHPLIHFGFGIGFQQPKVLAEALAQAACHNNFFGPFFFTCERLAGEHMSEQGASMVDLISVIRRDSSLYDSEYWDGGDSLVSERQNCLRSTIFLT